MRPSNRTKILEAAVIVAEQHGVTAVTLDSVAAEAGLTKSGLIYHFGSRESLMSSIQDHLAHLWEALLVEAAGKQAHEASVEERVAAYAKVAADSASSADLVFILEFSKNADPGPWADVAARWTLSPAEAADDPRMLDLFIARLAADGLWTFESLLQSPLDPGFRIAVANRIATLISPPGR